VRSLSAALDERGHVQKHSERHEQSDRNVAAAGWQREQGRQAALRMQEQEDQRAER